MPTYDYRCKTCGFEFEAFQSISAKPLETCPQCGKRVERLIGGGIGIIFKGSGYYCTDNKKSAATAAPVKSADTAAKTTAAAESAKETKTEKTKAKPVETQKAAS